MKKHNIEVTSDFDDLVIFKTTCSCNDRSHELEVIAEKYKNDKPIISIILNSSINTNGWSLIEKITRKIKIIYNILFHGYYEEESDFMFRDETQIDDFAKALQEARNQICQKK